MSLIKVSNLFHATTTDVEGNGKRIAGFSEQFYCVDELNSASLTAKWNRLCNARAALMPGNVSIVGGRFQTVDPIGGSKGFDTVFPPPTTTSCDQPTSALQFTVRSPTTQNQRSVIIRAIPDNRTLNGEYVPSPAYNTALRAYFAVLMADWGFRGLDRTILPIKIISIDADGIVTTAANHGLLENDNAMVMSAIRPNGRKVTDQVVVQAPVTARTFKIFVPRLGRDEPTPALLGTQRGRVRKIAFGFKQFFINDDEIIHPRLIARKVGKPFFGYVGRRTASRS